MKRYIPNYIFVEEGAHDFALTQDIIKRLPGIQVREIDSAKTLMQRLRSQSDPIGAGKRILFLANDKGRSFRPFSEAAQYLSCDYHTLHVVEGCDMECSYCILQTYLTNPVLTVFVNIEDMLAELEVTLKQNPGLFFRIGIGQLADALSLDHLTAFSEKLIPFFRQQSNAILELKTKSDNIDRLLSLSSEGKTIVSWSVNSHLITQTEEHKTAGLTERLRAARQILKETDHRVGFHFDPIIDYPGWEQDYKSMVQDTLTGIPEDRIAWISLGCLRFMPELKKIMQNRFPKSSLPLAEWIRGMDGKMRYFKPRRIEIYKQVVSWIKDYSPNITLYLSMESPEVWRKVFGYEATRESICKMLDKASLPPDGPGLFRQENPAASQRA